MLAGASGNRKILLVPVKELKKLTGYIREGVTALLGKEDISRESSAGMASS